MPIMMHLCISSSWMGGLSTINNVILQLSVSKKEKTADNNQSLILPIERCDDNKFALPCVISARRKKNRQSVMVSRMCYSPGWRYH